MSRNLENDLKRICKDLSAHCEEVVIIAKPQGRAPRVVTLGALPECMALTKFATVSLDKQIG